MRRTTAFFLGLVKRNFACRLRRLNERASDGPWPGPQAALVSVSLTDAPPAGVTVLTFEVTVDRCNSESRQCRSRCWKKPRSN